MRKNFTASLDNLYSMLAFIREQLVDLNFDPPVIAKVELASEEALVNIINYAYSAEDKEKPIDIECGASERPGIKISISDQGIAFDPLMQHTPSFPSDEEQSLGEKDVGGYGILLILKIMDQATYQRKENANVLTLVKYL